MGHCINVIIIKQENIKEEFTDFITLPQGFALLPIPDNDSILNEPYLEISTDYFGGVGEQHASFFNEDNSIMDIKGDYPIDDGLKMLGVVCDEGMDEFDTIHLNRFRDNRDIEVGLPSYIETHEETPAESSIISITTKIIKDKKGNCIIKLPEKYNEKLKHDIDYIIDIREDIMAKLFDEQYRQY